MKDWRRHWNEHPETFGQRQFLEQVGKTVNGRPVSEEQMRRIVAAIRRALELGGEDRVLDLCCGNGLVTHHLAPYVKRIAGVDYARPLLDVAREFHQLDRVEYLLGDVLELGPVLDDRRFDKAYLYEGLQYFSREQLPPLLRGLRAHLVEGAALYLASIPDRARIWSFHDTWRRRAGYVWRELFGNPALGTWWDRDELARLGAAAGFDVTLQDQDPELYTARYRFDAVLRIAG